MNGVGWRRGCHTSGHSQESFLGRPAAGQSAQFPPPAQEVEALRGEVGSGDLPRVTRSVRTPTCVFMGQAATRLQIAEAPQSPRFLWLSEQQAWMPARAGLLTAVLFLGAGGGAWPQSFSGSAADTVVPVFPRWGYEGGRFPSGPFLFPEVETLPPCLPVLGKSVHSQVWDALPGNVVQPS